MRKAALLKNPEEPSQFKIRLRLQEGKTAEFIYNDRSIARMHYDQLQGLGVVAGLAIKEYEYIEE